MRTKVLSTRATWQEDTQGSKRSKFGLKGQISLQGRLFKISTNQKDNLCHQKVIFKTLLEETSSFWKHPLSSRIQEYLHWRTQSKNNFLSSSLSKKLRKGGSHSTQVSISMTSFESVKMTYCKESNKLVGSSNFSAWKKRTDLNLIKDEFMGYIKGYTTQP